MKRKREDTSDDQPDSSPTVPWTSLPGEVWLSILSLLPAPALISVSRTCTSLRRLGQDPGLWTRVSIDWQSIKNKSQSCEDLVIRCLKLQQLTITNRTFEQVNSPMILGIIKKASRDSVTSLVISPELCLSNSAVSGLGRLSQLTSLELAGDWIKSSAVTELGHLEHLERLKMPGSEQVTSGDFKTLFTKLKKLKLVDVSECKKGMTDMSLIALVKNNPDLEYLAIDECELVTGKGVKMLADCCPKLKHISLDGCYQVNDAATSKLATSCSLLSYVSLSLNMIKDNTLTKLGQNCPSLEFLNLFGCSYLSERGIERLIASTSTSLKHLDMRGILGVSQSFSLRLEKEHPEINMVHQFQPKPPRERNRRRNQ